MDIHELVPIYTVTNPVEAEMIKNALNAQGIRCFIKGGTQAGEVGIPAFEIALEVPAEDADRARKFIRSHEPGTPGKRSGPRRAVERSPSR